MRKGKSQNKKKLLLTKANFTSHFFFLFFFFILFNSCRKADRDSDTGTQMISDNGFSSFFFNDLFKQVHQLALSDTALNTIGSLSLIDTSCIDTVRHSAINGTFPDTIIVDYGLSNGVACADGSFRKGKLKIIFSGKYGLTSKTFTVYTDNYYLNDYKVECKMIISGRSRNASNNLYFYVQLENGTANNDSLRYEFFAPANGQTTPFQREWISGETTPSIGDDIFQLSGTYGGKGSQGTDYEVEIISALKNQFDCKWNIAGIEKIVPLNLSPRVVDYGSGCDNKATVKINAKEYEVVLLP